MDPYVFELMIDFINCIFDFIYTSDYEDNLLALKI